MKFFKTLFVIVLFFLCSEYTSQVQDTTLMLIEKHDGTKYIAKILSDDSRELLIETSTIGKIYILKSDVKRITTIDNQDEIKNGELREESPFSTRYAFTNNALPIKRNDHYVINNLFGPEVHFAVNDRLNLGVMTTWLGSPFIGVGKFTIPTSNNKVNFSIASMFGTSGYLNGFKSFGGLHWGTFTYGDRKNNISISAGFGYIKPREPDSLDVVGVYYGSPSDYPDIKKRSLESGFLSAPIFSLAGIFQISNRASIFFDSMIASGFSRDQTSTNQVGGGNSQIVVTVTENNVSTTALYLMPGFRYQKSEYKAFQFAIVGVSVWESEENFTFPLPLLSWFRKF